MKINLNLNHEYFDKNGYLIIDDAFSMDDLLAFKQVLHNLICLTLDKYKINKVGLSLEEECNSGILELGRVNPDYPSVVQATISRSPEYFRLCSSPKLMLIIRKLMGIDECSPIYLTNNGVIFTNPNDEENKRFSNISIGWHKDTFFTLPGSRFLHIWMPLLHDATKDIGTLILCPGSHKNGVGNQKIHPTAPYDHRYSMDDREVKMFSPQSLELKIGQALVFDGNLIHRSGSNTSKNVRCTLIGLYHNVSNENFYPLTVNYQYKEKTPEEYYYEIFNDSDALPLLSEQSMK